MGMVGWWVGYWVGMVVLFFSSFKLFFFKKAHLNASHGEENIEILGYFGGD